MRTRSLQVATAGLAALALMASGCGDDDPDLVAGKELFVQKCGSCHTLARAGTQGVQGPNLDAAFGPSRADGLGAGTVKGVVLDQIGNVRANSTMPEDLVTGQDARNVAAYVGQVAGQRGKDEGALASAGKPEVSNKPIPAENGVIEMPADPTGALAFVSTRATAPVGALTMLSLNESPIDHNIAIRDPSGELLDEGAVVGTGGTSEAEGTLKAGEYEYVCTVPGHEAGGMKGTLTVE